MFKAWQLKRRERAAMRRIIDSRLRYWNIPSKVVFVCEVPEGTLFRVSEIPPMHTHQRGLDGFMRDLKLALYRDVVYERRAGRDSLIVRKIV